jgi:hypothetical protein
LFSSSNPIGSKVLESRFYNHEEFQKAAYTNMNELIFFSVSSETLNFLAAFENLLIRFTSSFPKLFFVIAIAAFSKIGIN